MPPSIVPVACPPPICNLSSRDVKQFVDALAAYHTYFAPAFHRPEQGTWATVYLNGLLSAQPRKTTERIALTQGVTVRDVQHFIGQSSWQCAPVITRHQQLVADSLGTPDGVLLIDESGVVKQGDKSSTVVRLAKLLIARSVCMLVIVVRRAIPCWRAGCICRPRGVMPKRVPNASSVACQTPARSRPNQN